jgi:hypothetical protein
MRGCINDDVLSPSLQNRMNWCIMDSTHFVLKFAELPPPPLKFIVVLLPWYQETFDPSASYIELLMTRPRPRGKPRRGSPWKPRRPSITPPDSTSDDSSPRHQSNPTPVSLRPQQFSSMAVIPRTPVSLLRILNDFPAVPHNPVTLHDPPSRLDGEPSPQGVPRGAGHNSQESFDREQFRNSLSVLHNLVFELRQEVADLHFRMQTTEAKVVSFLQIIVSLHAALFPDPVNDNEEEGQHRGLNQADRQQEAHEEGTEEAEDGKDVDKQWGDETVYIEEEPWPGDLQAAQTSHLPGV